MKELELLKLINIHVCGMLGCSPDIVPCYSSDRAAYSLAISSRCLDDLRHRDRVGDHRAAGRVWYPIAGLIYALDYYIVGTHSVSLTETDDRHTSLAMKAIDALHAHIPLFVLADRPVKIAFDKKSAAKAIDCSTREIERMVADGRLRRSTLCRGKVLIPHWSVAQAVQMTTG